MQWIKTKLLFILVIAFTIHVKAAPELRVIKNDSISEYEITRSDPQFVAAINDVILTTNWWHSLKNGDGAYTFSALVRTLQGPHLHLVEDEPLIIKGTRKGVEAIKVKEVVVGLYSLQDGSLIANSFFAVTTEGEIVVLQKYSGHKIMTELVPLINKPPHTK